MASFGQHVHFIGIGGSGMQGLADVLLSHGCRVTGSDTGPPQAYQRLVRRGAMIWKQHAPQNVPLDTDLVVYSAAIKPDNPELVAAAQRGLPRLKYAEMLGQLMATRRGICISGTHGKSTTSAMVGCMLHEAGLDPTVVVGGVVPQLGGSARGGLGPFMVAESCEYDRSFLNLVPRAIAILNIQEDHLDYYSGLEEIIEAFRSFAALVPEDGLVVANGQRPEVLQAAAGSPARIETFAIGEPATWRADILGTWYGRHAFDVYHEGEFFGRFSLLIPGRHNVMNSLAAIGLAHWAGVPGWVMETTLAGFRGVARRFEIKGQCDGITLVDDYAHHPTEIQATLKAAREYFQGRRLWVVFQPHQHSRTRHLLKDFARSFDNADKVLVPDIYFVRDSLEERTRVSSRDLVREITNLNGDAHYLPTLPEIVDFLATHLQSGDVLFTMGAGDVWKVADELAGRLQRHHKAG